MRRLGGAAGARPCAASLSAPVLPLPNNGVPAASHCSSHRIGQSKEVRVIHLEAVADAARGSMPPPTHPAALAAVAAGKTLYADSIESMVRGRGRWWQRGEALLPGAGRAQAVAGRVG